MDENTKQEPVNQDDQANQNQVPAENVDEKPENTDTPENSEQQSTDENQNNTDSSAEAETGEDTSEKDQPSDQVANVPDEASDVPSTPEEGNEVSDSSQPEDNPELPGDSIQPEQAGDTVEAKPNEEPKADEPEVLEEGTIPGQPQPSEESSEQTPAQTVVSGKATAEKSDNHKLVTIIVALLVTLLLVGIGYAAYRNSNDQAVPINSQSAQNSQAQSTNQEQATAVDTTTVDNETSQVDDTLKQLDQLDSQLDASQLDDQQLGI